MAPEQILGDPIDARTDVFAAGAVLFEALAGRAAFPGTTAVEVMHATLHEQPPALAGPPAVVAFDRVIRRALAKAPAERYPTRDRDVPRPRERRPDRRLRRVRGAGPPP